MDTPEANRRKLFRTYSSFSVINRFLTGWHTFYEDYIRPLAREKRPLEILDIGFGGGDIAYHLDRWARRDHLVLSITGIETDSRAIDYVGTRSWPGTITFEHCTTRELVKDGRRFDVIISNHLVHHLSPEVLGQTLSDCENLCRRLILFNDLERSPLAFALFSVFAIPLSIGSYIACDGRISIRKSYRIEEMKSLLPDGWIVRRTIPWHLLITKEYKQHPVPERSHV